MEEIFNSKTSACSRVGKELKPIECARVSAGILAPTIFSPCMGIVLEALMTHNRKQREYIMTLGFREDMVCEERPPLIVAFITQLCIRTTEPAIPWGSLKLVMSVRRARSMWPFSLTRVTTPPLGLATRDQHATHGLA